MDNKIAIPIVSTGINQNIAINSFQKKSNRFMLIR
jgi:hypothetical protein